MWHNKSSVKSVTNLWLQWSYFLWPRAPEVVSAGLYTLNYWIKLTNCTSFMRNQTIAGNSYDFEARCDRVRYRKFMMQMLCGMIWLPTVNSFCRCNSKIMAKMSCILWAWSHTPLLNICRPRHVNLVNH